MDSFSCDYEEHLRNDTKCHAKGKKCTSVRKLEILKDSVGVLGRYGKIRQIAEQPDQSDEDRT